MWSSRPNWTDHEFPLCHDHRGSRDPGVGSVTRQSCLRHRQPKSVMVKTRTVPEEDVFLLENMLVTWLWETRFYLMCFYYQSKRLLLDFFQDFFLVFGSILNFGFQNGNRNPKRNPEWNPEDDTFSTMCCCDLFPLKNLVWSKVRDDLISRANPLPKLMFLIRVVMIW